MGFSSKIEWFVHPDTDPPCPLGIIRTHGGGALVIGGRTGSHMTGHGESYSKKMIVDSGYIDLTNAINRNIVSASWSPPTLDDQDAYLVKKIETHKL
jgi:hypothetical protein